MAQFNYQLIEEVAKELYIRALKFLPPDVKAALEKAYAKETDDTDRSILKTIFQNIENPEAIYKLWVKDCGPLIVAMDAHGKHLYFEAKAKATEKLHEIYRQIVVG